MIQPEKEIIAGILKRDEKILLSFYKAHHQPVFRFIFRQIGKEDVAEEMAQDVFIDFIEGLRDFRGDSSLKTYLFSIARFKIIDYIKKKKLKKILFSALPPNIVDNIVSVLVDDEIERSDLANRIDRILNRLPNDYRIVIRLKYMDGRKVKEIANQLMLSFKATESLLFRARQAFMEEFREAG